MQNILMIGLTASKASAISKAGGECFSPARPTAREAVFSLSFTKALASMFRMHFSTERPRAGPIGGAALGFALWRADSSQMP